MLLLLSAFGLLLIEVTNDIQKSADDRPSHVKKHKNTLLTSRNVTQLPQILKQAVTVNSDRKKYNFKLSEFGNSWLIGTDSTGSGNAFLNGLSDCPENLIIPKTLIDEKGEEKKVEVIGQWAFNACGCGGCHPILGITKKLTITQNVKVIKRYGLGWMFSLESFIIEPGSVLEKIEEHGLDGIGKYTLRDNPTFKRGILTLPYTLSSVDIDGIYQCDLFNIIIYCGPHPLDVPCELETTSISAKTGVNVTNDYPNKINLFSRTPNRSPEAEEEAEARCKSLDFQNPDNSYSGMCYTHMLASMARLLSLVLPLLSSHSLFSPVLSKLLPSLSFPFA